MKLGLSQQLMPKRAEVTGDWRKIHDEELHDMHFFTKYCAGY